MYAAIGDAAYNKYKKKLARLNWACAAWHGVLFLTAFVSITPT